MESITTFLKKSLWFIVPPLLLLAGIEWYLAGYPSTFNIKAKFIHANKQFVEAIVLGSSHNQMAVNPELIPATLTANLAMAGQDLQLDSCLLARYLPEMPGLKYCFLEVSYHSLEHANEAEYDRNNLYLRFHDINNFGRATTFVDCSIFLPQPKRYISFLNPFHTPTKLNRFGFATELSRFEQDQNRFESLGYDESKIRATTDNILIRRHRYEDIDAYHENCRIAENMIRMCIGRNVVPVILIPPVFDTYSNSMISAKKERRDRFLQLISSKYPRLTILNHESDTSFKVVDFKNDDHLDPQGAAKFTRIISDFLSAKPEREVTAAK
jgi:hypothetical protein